MLHWRYKWRRPLIVTTVWRHSQATTFEQAGCRRPNTVTTATSDVAGSLHFGVSVPAAVSDEFDAVQRQTGLMAGTPASRCPPNLLGGSLRTTTPGCIRPLFFPGSVQLRFDSPLLSKTTAPSSSRVSGNGTETSTSNHAAVQLHDQRSAGQSSGVDAADRKITESKTPYTDTAKVDFPMRRRYRVV